MSKNTAISPENNEIFLAVNREVTWLHTVWDLYIQLYGTSDENMEIMNSSAPLFFSIIQNILFEELAITINRLTEKHKTFGKDNACLEQLFMKTGLDKYPTLVSTLQFKLKEIRNRASSFRTWRDKKIAHSDLQTALKKSSELLPGITRQYTQELIDKIGDYINEFSSVVLDITQVYKPFLTGYGDGKELLRVLKIALDEKNSNN